MIFGAGANVVITEEPLDVKEKEQPEYSLLNYALRIYKNFDFQDLSLYLLELTEFNRIFIVDSNT